jgi:S-formylglutathione hydrolase FrmB
MDKDIGTLVIVPDNYESSQWSYRSVYILHGAGGDYGNWMRRVPELEELADEHKFILVFPDGGKTSWYLDSPVDTTMMYETYIIDELIPEVDKTYRTQPHRLRRAITGLSMGGHGALYLSLRHPEIFSSAGSMSGGVDLRPFMKNWDLPLRLGKASEHPKNWEQNSVTVITFLMMEKTHQNFIIDCGTEDVFIDVNRDLDRIMDLKGMQYEYSEREGGHNWAFWRESIVNHLNFFKVQFDKHD